MRNLPPIPPDCGTILRNLPPILRGSWTLAGIYRLFRPLKGLPAPVRAAVGGGPQADQRLDPDPGFVRAAVPPETGAGPTRRRPIRYGDARGGGGLHAICGSAAFFRLPKNALSNLPAHERQGRAEASWSSSASGEGSGPGRQRLGARPLPPGRDFGLDVLHQGPLSLPTNRLGPCLDRAKRDLI